MNANVPMLDEVAGNNTKEVIEALNKTIRQQQAEIAELETGLKNVWKVVEGKQTEIEALKDEVAKWKMSYENNIRFEDGYGHN